MNVSNDTELAFASVEDVARLFRKRKLSPVELTKILLSRIERLNPKLNAYITVTAELALAQAKKAESELFALRGREGHRDRGPLHGIPISLKDNIYAKDIRTTAGSKILKDFVPLHDATVVSQLKNAGAVILGKTNMHEFAYGVTSNNPHYGPVRNPWALDRISGGSSGGSAAAVAAGLCYGSIGTDTGGSIRIPASLCGIVGLKPSWGQVNEKGVIPLSRTLDCVGPLARSGRDAALLFRAIAWKGMFLDLPVPRRPEFRRLRRFTLGLPTEFFFEIISPEVQAAIDSALKKLRRLGGKLKEISIPLLTETEVAGNNIAWAEATHYHQQSGWFPSQAADYGEDVRTRLEMGTKVPDAAFFEAMRLRSKFIDQLFSKMSKARIHALAVPTTPITAPFIGEEKSRIDNKLFSTRALLLRLNRPANLAGVPAISIPCGFTSAGLPVGLQLIGLRSPLEWLLPIAYAFERTHPSSRRPAL
jgi:aspartyl-tRNA(Asn)/glutamyl-tRNA(Gln) amidotransferase subunit A